MQYKVNWTNIEPYANVLGNDCINLPYGNMKIIRGNGVTC